MSDTKKTNPEEKVEINDQMISSAVQSLRFSIPDALDKRLFDALETDRDTNGSNRPVVSRPSLWFPLTAAAVLLVAVIVMPGFLKDRVGEIPQEPINEIKTEFQISNSNIKILWVQKKDFKLRR